MTDFGSRKQIGDASAANQAIQITAIQATQAAVEGQTAQAAVTPVNAQVFDNIQSTYTSDAMAVANYRAFILRIILAVTLAPTDIIIEVLVSFSGESYEKYMSGPFGSLVYEDTGGSKSEAVRGEIIAPLMKIRATATGVDASNKFTLTCKVALSR